MIQFWSNQTDYNRRREVVIVDRRGDREFIAAPLVFTDKTGRLCDPTITEHGTEFLQAALDHAWEIGLRPRGFSDVPQQIEAMRAHLADMRALVFMRHLPALVPPAFATFKMENVPAGLEDG